MAAGKSSGIDSGIGTGIGTVTEFRNGIRERPSNNIIDKNDLQDVHGQFDRARSLGLPRQSGRVHVLKPLGHGLAPTRSRLVYDDHVAVDAEGAAERRCGCTARYIVVKSKGTSSKFWFWF